jgi:endonuclease/exonuclease/phosphatase family metal-dependent hydrolase
VKFTPFLLRVLQVFSTAGTVLRPADPTVPARAPRYKIDYIFAYPRNNWEILQDTVWNVQLSDHLPIGAVVQLK